MGPPRRHRERSTDDEQPASFARRSWKWIAGAVIGGLALVISGWVVKANDWFASKVHTESAVTAVVRTNEDFPPNGWFFATSPAKLPLPNFASFADPNTDKRAVHREWVRSNGGIPVSGYYVTAVLQAAKGKTVVVDGLRVEVTRRVSPPKGVSPDERGCGGGLVPVRFEANLDTYPVRITPKPGEDEGGRPTGKPPSLPRIVTEASPDYWQISAVTSKWDADWIAFIDYTADGKAGTIRIDNHGKPFRTVTLNGATGVRADSTSKQWEVLPEPRPPIC